MVVCKQLHIIFEKKQQLLHDVTLCVTRYLFPLRMNRSEVLIEYLTFLAWKKF